MFSAHKNREECNRLRDALEISTGLDALADSLRAHLAGCADCRTAADEVFTSRAFLQGVAAREAEEPGSWFTSRVMAAIAARERSLRRSQEAWVLVPKLAARLTWISALALLLAGTWLYERPRTNTKIGSESGVESLFDTPSAAPQQEDAFIGLERGQ